MNSAEQKESVLRALASIVDPEIGINIVDLGLIESIALPDPHSVVIEMLVTSPGCPLRETLAHGATEVLLAMPGIRHAEVRIVEHPAWNPRRIRPGALADEISF